MDAQAPPALPPDSPARETRRALRERLIALRRAQPEAQIAAWSARIQEHLATAFPQLAGLRVGFCWPIQNEPDLRPLLAQWRATGQPGFAALLPVVVAPATPLAFRAWDDRTPLIEDRYGIPYPPGGEFVCPEALLIPVNAFDAAGFRLGYGGGFFDRTLAALTPRPLTIGIGFELARVENIAPAAHDVALDAVVTEAGVFRP